MRLSLGRSSAVVLCGRIQENISLKRMKSQDDIVPLPQLRNWCHFANKHTVMATIRGNASKTQSILIPTSLISLIVENEVIYMYT